MNILITGGSSFTGFWFARSLAQSGYSVTATMTRAHQRDYGDSDVRLQRVKQLEDCCQLKYGVRFGTSEFQTLARSRPFDIFCHHAADVTDYHSPEFDVTRAVVSNCYGLDESLECLTAGGCRIVLATGSVFEGGEGAGSEGLPHFSPYGLSKSLSFQVIDYYARRRDMVVGKFVIPNPFGPWEEPRFCNYLVRSWVAGETPVVRTPLYVRDNIQVELLAKAYVHFVESLVAYEMLPGYRRRKVSPHGYIEPQGDFARRFAMALQPRLGLECPVELAEQVDFSEPRIRVNTDSIDDISVADEERAWDGLAGYYANLFQLSAAPIAIR